MSHVFTDANESDFKIKLKIIRAWKKYTSDRKLSKISKEESLRQWIVAIHFHE
jgi:hypothetical protein